MAEACALSIIIVSYNTRAMTLACLDSLAAGAAATPFEVIVVDNASSDGSAEAIAAAHPDVALIRSPRNLGFARANNLAAGRAGAELLLLLNPDTVVSPGAIDRLVAFGRARPRAGVWGGRTRFADGRLNPGSCWRQMTLWGLACRAAGLTAWSSSPLFNPEGYGGWQRDDEREVDIVSGCFLLIGRALWRRLGGFDERFRMYGEDADLCLRARALGARPRLTPGAEIVHHGGGSEPVRADKLVRLLSAKAALLDKHWRGGRRRLGLALLACWPLSRLAMTSLLRDAEARRAWAEVWRRRGEWREGWPPR